MRKILHGVECLISEYRVMHKPDRRTLMKDTLRIAGTAVLAGIVLKVVDVGFATLLEMVL